MSQSPHYPEWLGELIPSSHYRCRVPSTSLEAVMSRATFWPGQMDHLAEEQTQVILSTDLVSELGR